MYNLTRENTYVFKVGEVEMKVSNILLNDLHDKPYDEMVVQFYSPYGQCEMTVQYIEMIVAEYKNKLIFRTINDKLLELTYVE